MIGRRTLAAALSALVLVLSVALAEAADKKVIRLWQTETEPQTLAVLNQMAAEYEKTHPDVSVKIEGLAWGDLEKKLTAALAAGAPPDAAHRSEEHTSELQSHSDLVCRLLLEKK